MESAERQFLRDIKVLLVQFEYSDDKSEKDEIVWEMRRIVSSFEDVYTEE